MNLKGFRKIGIVQTKVVVRGVMDEEVDLMNRGTYPTDLKVVGLIFTPTIGTGKRVEVGVVVQKMVQDNPNGSFIESLDQRRKTVTTVSN